MIDERPNDHLPQPDPAPEQHLPHEYEDRTGYRFRLPKNVVTPPEQLQAFAPEEGAVFDWDALFGRQAPVHVEIGFGKGRFLVNAAERSRDINYFGIEYARKYYVWTLRRFMRRDCHNVRLYHGDAKQAVAQWMAPQSVDAFHIYFSDPWPKKRHHKRRLFQKPFINELARVTKERGTVYVVTDALDYGEIIQELFSTVPLFTIRENDVRTNGTGFTNFEAKYLKEGRSFHHITVERNAHPTPDKGR